ncbi:hypothetical protein J2X68_002377 [Streptomyces sp. 3330]|uniref:hypothetical protein n=1 Tax=Streptomyces sp. 3330 TaxID=2817755 RepID=UPI002855BC77|nr:hypothetical protein [Streptomyces sp. 3330]MDR6975693.1 hypothetical protein [Streptomyces sp. 3330]
MGTDRAKTRTSRTPVTEKRADRPARAIPRRPVVDPRKGTTEVPSEPCGGRSSRTESSVHGDEAPFGPWTVQTDGFGRDGKARDRRDRPAVRGR